MTPHETITATIYRLWLKYLSEPIGSEMPSVQMTIAESGNTQEEVQDAVSWAISNELLLPPRGPGLPPAPCPAGMAWYEKLFPEAAPEAAKPKKRTPKPKPEPEPETHAEDAATYVIDSNEAAYIAQAHERRDREEAERAAVEAMAESMAATVARDVWGPPFTAERPIPYSEVTLTPVPAPPPKPRKLIEVLAARHMIESGKFYDLVRNQLISVRSNEPPASPEEVALVMHTMYKYDLDPIVNQIYAFRSQGKLRVVVGYDGRVKISSRDPGFLGITYEEGPVIDAGDLFPSLKGKNIKAVEFIKATLNHERRKPTTITVWLREWMLPTVDNWLRYPNHRLRLKAYSSIIREIYALGAADDEDYLQMYESGSAQQAHMQGATVQGVDQIRQRIANGG